MNKKIIIKNLSISFGENNVLSSINLCFDAGKIIGIEGPNGSGKTVFMKSISGFLHPSKGAIIVYGDILYKDVEFPRDMVVSFENGFVSHLSGFKNLELINSIDKKYSSFELKKILELVGLVPDNKTAYSKYSTGMKQKLRIAQVVLRDANLILLDEVLNGLDKKSTVKMKNLIKDMNKAGKTIIMTSHIVGDLEDMCDEIYVVNEKKLTLKESL